MRPRGLCISKMSITRGKCVGVEVKMSLADWSDKSEPIGIVISRGFQFRKAENKPRSRNRYYLYYVGVGQKIRR